MASTYTVVSVPKNENEGGAYWFVMDRQTRTAVAEVRSLKAGQTLAATIEPGTYVSFIYRGKGARLDRKDGQRVYGLVENGGPVAGLISVRITSHVSSFSATLVAPKNLRKEDET